jgi:uncharacterized protein YecE (DUF72 family)
VSFTRRNFAYCRLHASQELYASGYDAEALDTWAQRVVTWAWGGEVYAAEGQVNTTRPHESVAMSLSILTTT